MKQKEVNRTELSWIMYDVAFSSYVLIIITTFGQSFFKLFITKGVDSSVSTSNWAFAMALGSVMVALLSPILGTFADYKGYKKKFLVFFIISGVISTFLLIFVNQGQSFFYLTLIVISWFCYNGSNIFYDALLIDVTTDERMDWISSSGFAWGYIGGNIPYIFCIIIYVLADKIPFIDQVIALKIAFCIVSIWWLLFSIPIIRRVKQTYYIEHSKTPIRDSFKRLLNTFKEIKEVKHVFLFICAYFFYIDGVHTVITIAASYAHDAGFDTALMLLVVLVIQFVAFPCTLIYGKLSKKFKTKTLIYFGISIYTVIIFIAFLIPFFNTLLIKQILLWCIAIMVGSSQGGIQALSRSFFGKIIPKDKSAEFFGFYNTLGKFAAIIGPLLIGLATRITGDSRYGVLSIVFLFIIGIIFFRMVKVES